MMGLDGGLGLDSLEELELRLRNWMGLVGLGFQDLVWSFFGLVGCDSCDGRRGPLSGKWSCWIVPLATGKSGHARHNLATHPCNMADF